MRPASLEMKFLWSVSFSVRSMPIQITIRIGIVAYYFATAIDLSSCSPAQNGVMLVSIDVVYNC